MVTIDQYRLGSLDTNCYLVMEDALCFIIDPADEANFIAEQIQRQNSKPIAIFLTHGHFDHMLAAGALQMIFNIPVYIALQDFSIIKRALQTVKHFQIPQVSFIEPNLTALIPSCKELKDFRFKPVFTPGHTPGGCCFYSSNNKILFSGDTLFADGIGSYDHSYSDKNSLIHNVKKLLTYPEDTLVYSGHGGVSTIGQIFDLLSL